jgi:hypothetical protein
MPEWEEYNPNCFVARQQDRQQCLQWIELPQPKYRVYSFVGAAGIGKTWLLKALEHDLRGALDAPYQPVPIWLSFPSLAKELVEGTPRYADAVHSWLIELRDQIAARYPAIPDVARDVMVRQMVEVLVEPVCEHAGFRPVLLVEGYDEVANRQAVQIARDVLYPFAGKPQARIIMGRRDTKLRDVDELRWKEKQVILAVNATPREQFARFREENFPDIPDSIIDRLPEIQQLVPGYAWNPYYINAYLFNVALSRLESAPAEPIAVEDLITVEDRENCCWELINRGGPRAGGNIDQKQFHQLKQIAQRLERSWSEAILQQNLSIRLKDLESLFVYGTIYRDHATAQRYHVAEGLYELLAELPA